MSNVQKHENSDILESARSREIVSEILNFGVSQHQIKTIIKLLSLELEDITLMKELSSMVDDNLNDNNETTKIEI